MSGKVFISGFLVFVALFGAALFYFQNFAFYQRVAGLESIDVQGVAVAVSDYEGIDARSSGLKRRGCFRVDPGDFSGLAAFGRAKPLNPPFWFDCFDPDTLAHDLESGAAQAYLAATEEFDGIDRVVAVYPDGRAYEWRQLNEKFAE